MPESKLCVFLCHASQDKPVVRELSRRLAAEPWIDPWLDEEKLVPNQEWDVEIPSAIRRSDVILICLSTNSVSKEGYFQREVRLALDISLEKPEGTIFIIPIRLNDCMIPNQLQQWQHVDYFPQERRQSAYAKIIQSLRLRADSLGYRRVMDDSSALTQQDAGEVHQGDDDTAISVLGVPVVPNDMANTTAVRRSRTSTRPKTNRTKRASKVQTDESRNEYRYANFVINDSPTGEDRLGYDNYADAFAKVLVNPETKTPLTVGIYGEWGIGKSFLMSKIKEQLKKEFAPRGSEPRTPEKKQGQSTDFHFVHFNPWLYSGSDHLWAGLVTGLYREVEKCFGPSYLNWYLLRQKLKKDYEKNIVIFLSYGLIAIFLALLLDFEIINEQWTALKIALNALAGGSMIATIGLMIKAGYELLMKLVAVRSEELAKYSARKDFRDKIGIMADIKTEIGHISEMLMRGKKGRSMRFVIFIDDLDRCPPKKAVEVLEAVMLLLADKDGAPYVIFLGIDARVVVKAIEESYGKTLVEAGISGYEFLDKIVQIPFCIPAVDQANISTYVNSLLDQGQQQTGSSVETVSNLPAAPEPVRQSATAGSPAPPQEPVVSNRQPSGIAPATEPEVPFDEYEKSAFARFSSYLVSNPRRIKRIVNIYRIIRLLAGQINVETRQKLIKWVILSEQWPYRSACLLQAASRGNVSNVTGKRPKQITVDFLGQLNIQDEIRTRNLDLDTSLFDQMILTPPLYSINDIRYLKKYSFNLNPALLSEIKGKNYIPKTRRVKS